MNVIAGTVRLLRVTPAVGKLPEGRDIVPDARAPVTYHLGIEDGAFQFRVTEATLTVPDGERAVAAALFDSGDRMLIWVRAEARAGETIHLEEGWGLTLSLPAANRRHLNDRRNHDRRATCADPNPAHHSP